MISISDDRSELITDAVSPLDVELNLTEYEMKIRAMNGIGSSDDDSAPLTAGFPGKQR